MFFCFFFQAEDGIRDLVRSRGLGDVYKRQEYDPSIDSWSQKATFPGLAREASTAFSVSGFGYMGLGLGSAGAFNDIYKYDAGLNTWSAVADFPSINFDPVSFVIGNIAYVGTGSSTYPNLNLTNHFWQYNPDSNSWSAIPDMGGTKRLSAVSFAIDSFGYCGTGGYGTATYNLGDLWQYGPSGVGISAVSYTHLTLPTSDLV